MTKSPNVFLLLFFLLLNFSCRKNPIIKNEEQLNNEEVNNEDNYNNIILNNNSVDSSSFYFGNFTAKKLTPSQLLPLNGSMLGNPIVVSNNPEQIQSTGWLFRNPIDTNTGNKLPNAGKFSLYLYHQNQMSVPIYIHVLISNPNSTSIMLNAKGNVFTIEDYNGNLGKGYGPSYKVAENWMKGIYTHNFSSKIISAYSLGSSSNYQTVATILLNPNKSIDGRFEFNSYMNGLQKNCYTYVVASTSSNPLLALNLAQTTQATGNFIKETNTTFGRECGIYANSVWKSFDNIYLPNRSGYIGFCLNTAQKAPYGLAYQNQNSQSLGVINSSSSRTYGNYGCYYYFGLKFLNKKTQTRNVKLYLVHTIFANQGGFTWHAPIKINSSPLQETYLTFVNNKQLIDSFVIPASKTGINTSTIENIKFFVPGLITTNMELIVELD